MLMVAPRPQWDPLMNRAAEWFMSPLSEGFLYTLLYCRTVRETGCQKPQESI